MRRAGKKNNRMCNQNILDIVFEEIKFYGGKKESYFN